MARTFTRPPRRALNSLADQVADRPEATIANLRDQAIIGALRYADASLDAVIALRVEDYYSVGNRRWLRIVEDGIERHQLVNVNLEYLVDKYLLASGIEGDLRAPLFRSTLSGSGKISGQPIRRHHVSK